MGDSVCRIVKGYLIDTHGDPTLCYVGRDPVQKLFYFRPERTIQIRSSVKTQAEVSNLLQKRLRFPKETLEIIRDRGALAGDAADRKRIFKKNFPGNTVGQNQLVAQMRPVKRKRISKMSSV